MKNQKELRSALYYISCALDRLAPIDDKEVFDIIDRLRAISHRLDGLCSPTKTSHE